MFTPTANFQFARAKKLDPRIIASLATGSYVRNASGLMVPTAVNEPMFDHDINGNSLGLFFDPSSTNYVLNNVSPTLTHVNAGVDSAFLDPTGTAYAKAYVPNTTSTIHSLGSSANDKIDISALTAGQTKEVCISGYFAAHGPLVYSPSFTVLASNGTDTDYAILRLNASTGAQISKLVETEFTEIVAPIIYQVATGLWYFEWSLKYTQPATVRTRIGFYVQIYNEANQQTYAGDGLSGMVLYGHQLENRIRATRTILTTGSAVTRAKAFGKISDLTGLVNRDSTGKLVEGTLVVRGRWRYSTSQAATYPRFVSLTDNTIQSDVVQVIGDTSGGQIISSVRDGDVVQASYSTAVSTDTDFCAVVSYKDNRSVIAINGTASAVDTSCTMPTVDRLMFAAVGDEGANACQTWLHSATLYPRAVDADTAAAMSKIY